MNEPLFSSSWYRVADLKPQLRSHAKIHRQQYRGRTWYILQDFSTEKFHRFSPAAYFLIGLMDGTRTVQELWDLAAERLGDDSPTQDQMIHLLSQLHAADVLQCNITPNTHELFQRYQKQRRKQWQSRLFSVFSWRFPLFDPERFLQKFLPVVQPFFSWGGALLWLLLVVPAIVAASVHWTELSENFIDRVMTPHNLFFLWLLFPCLKLIHELGHGFAVKYFGGEVHEMGIMILVLTPVPYVDASSSWGFREKWKRIAVSSAGMGVELVCASLALFLWLSVEPGTVRTLAYNTMLIAGISTILFNANPLLRFDGYYMFSDFLEIPNLRNRSNSYLGYLCERYLFGRKDAEIPEAASGERGWFVTFGISAFFYRIFIMVAIILFLLDEYFMVGVVLGLFGLVAWVCVPVGKGLKFLFTSPRIRRVRRRAVLVTAAIVVLVVCSIAFVPVPFRTVSEGVVWIPDESIVRAEIEGFISEIVVSPGGRVEEGEVLIKLVNPNLTTNVRVLQGRRRELMAQYRAIFQEDKVRASIVLEELRIIEQELKEAQWKHKQLIIHSQTEGTVVIPKAVDLLGRFIHRGDQVGYVVNLESVTVRAVVTQEDIELVQYQTQRIQGRLAERFAETSQVVLKRIVPTAAEDLPSSALGSEGGGAFPINPMESDDTKAVQKVFQIDLEMPALSGLVNSGGRVYLRFDHGLEPLGQQWFRQLRQLFLTRFNV